MESSRHSHLSGARWEPLTLRENCCIMVRVADVILFAQSTTGAQTGSSWGNPPWSRNAILERCAA